MKDRYQVPQRGEEPSVEMIFFLNENPKPWSGDDEGIVFEIDDEVVIAWPGDWVVRGPDGAYTVERAPE